MITANDASQNPNTTIEHKIKDNVTLRIGDSINISNSNKFRMIYFDPPFNSDRDYKLNCDSELGFSDKWRPSDYEDFKLSI